MAPQPSMMILRVCKKPHMVLAVALGQQGTSSWDGDIWCRSHAVKVEEPARMSPRLLIDIKGDILAGSYVVKVNEPTRKIRSFILSLDTIQDTKRT